jgi:hypothetical protein
MAGFRTASPLILVLVVLARAAAQQPAPLPPSAPAPTTPHQAALPPGLLPPAAPPVVRFNFSFKPNTPVKDLLPIAPKVNRCPDRS